MPPADLADEDLMVNYQAGDARAFELLLTRHRKPLFNFLCRLTGDRTLAEDLLQETFMRVIRGAASYQRQAKFTTWVYTIARNLCIDQSRRKKHRNHASLDAPLRQGEDATLMDNVPGREPNAERRLAVTQLHGRLQLAIDALPADQREVLIMREFQDLQFKEIAEIVGASENTVKSRMRYALEKLRLELAEYAEPGKEVAV